MSSVLAASYILIYFYCFAPPLCHLLPRGYTRSPDLNVWEKCSTCKHTQTHTLRRRRQQALGTLLLTIILEMFLANSFQPFSSLVRVAGGKIYLSQTVQTPECSSTHRKSSEHRTKERSPGASSFLSCGCRYCILHVSEVPLTRLINKLNISLN